MGKVLDALNRTVAYLDLTGSGAETIAHTRENGRIPFMEYQDERPTLQPWAERQGDDGLPALDP